MRIITNPDKRLANNIRRQIKENDGYCPCSIVKDDEHKCMCKDFKEQDFEGECHCGLYIKKGE